MQPNYVEKTQNEYSGDITRMVITEAASQSKDQYQENHYITQMTEHDTGSGRTLEPQ